MAAPLGTVLSGVLRQPLPTAAPVTLLDVASSPVTAPTIDIDVTANDPIAGNISAPVITSGPVGGTVTVVGNQLRLTHAGVGVYVIAYTSAIGALTDTGFCTVSITSTGVSGTPPGVHPSVYESFQTNNVSGHSIVIPPGDPLPADTRGLILGVESWLEFGQGNSQNITSFPVDYAGNPMQRLDGFDDVFYVGNDGVGVGNGGPGPATYAFVLLSSPTFTIPTSGTVNWSIGLSSGLPELHIGRVIAITHPSRHLEVSELNSLRSAGSQVSTSVPATAEDNSTLVAFAGGKKQVSPISAPGWTSQGVTIGNHPGGSNIQSGRLHAETRVYATGGNADYLASSDQDNLHAATIIQFKDPAGGVTPPVKNDTTANVATAGQVLVDMSVVGAPITAVDLVSGEGAASFSGTTLTFDAPLTDQVCEVDVAQANDGGGVISRVTITVTTAPVVTLGPRTGPGVGFGQTGTTALSSAVNALVASSVRPALEAAHDRNMTDQEIRNANPGFTDLLGTSGAALVAELNAGNRNLILRNDRQYNWSDLGNNQNTPTAGMQLVGLNGANVIVGGTPKNAGQRRWQIRGDVRLEGIDFRDGAILTSAVGLTSTVNEVSIRHCKSTNMANLFHHELDNGVSNNLVINQLTIRNNICTNVRDGVNARLGNGLTGPLGTIVNADIQDNIIDGWIRYGIALHYDTPPAGFNYNANSHCLIKGNLITNSDVPFANCFTIATAAFRTDEVLGNWLINNSRHGVNVDHEAIYTKAFQGTWADNFVWNSGQNDFQGIFGMKAQDAASPDSAGTLEVHNNFIGTDQGDTTGMLFVQRDNVDIHHNVLVVGADTTVGTTQGSSPFINLQFHDNLIRNNSTTNFGAWGLGGDNANFTFFDNTWDLLGSGVQTAYNFRSSTAGGRDLDDIEVRGDTFNSIGSGNHLAIYIERRTGAIINPKILNNQFNDFPRAIVINGGTVTGTIAFTGNQRTGQNPATTNNTASVVVQFGAGGGNNWP